ncbi:hypothetical protein [Trinickia sp.]|uniref:hypothetical protein n=1 Tax=Trinickia sp. TaxID=2571163 RepID=UPI003F7ED1CA
MPVELSHLPSGIPDAGADAHHAIVPFTPQQGSAHTAFSSASAGETTHAAGPMVPLKAAHLRNIDPMHLVALMMHAFGMMGGHAEEGIKTAGQAAARDARELDEHLGETHAPLLLMPAPAGEHEGAQAAGDPAGAGTEKPGTEAPVSGQVAQGHGNAPAPHGHGAPAHASLGHAQPEHEPAVSADGGHGHGNIDAETLSHVSARGPDTEHALDQQASTMKEMLEFQAKMTAMNTEFKMQSDLLQSMQKMTNDAADGAKYG